MPDSRAKIEHRKDAEPKLQQRYIEARGRSEAKIRSREAGADFKDGPLLAPIAEQGTHEQLLACSGRYAAMYATWMSHTDRQAA